jgi:S-adenosyl-L-methionine hydrolase (adenosine-forming)
MKYDWVSFTSDYGRVDGFVAACTGTIVRMAPHVRVIDVTHDVPPGDIRRGAAVLAQTAGYLPPAVHLVVVDPGVGTQRRGLVLEIRRGILVGPDNGVLLPAAEALGGILAAYELTERAFWAYQPSPTFHGRDVFAPVVAHLAAGAEPSKVGRELPEFDLVRLPEPLVRVRQGELTAEVLTIDRFGNVQLAAKAVDLESAALRPPQHVTVELVPTVSAAGVAAREPSNGGQPAAGASARPAAGAEPGAVSHGAEPGAVSHGAGPGAVSPPPRGIVGRTFADVAPGELVLFVDSARHAALAVNGGSAADTLRVAQGQLIRVISCS